MGVFVNTMNLSIFSILLETHIFLYYHRTQKKMYTPDPSLRDFYIIYLFCLKRLSQFKMYFEI